jgi:hypothetical protein
MSPVRRLEVHSSQQPDETRPLLVLVHVLVHIYSQNYNKNKITIKTVSRALICKRVGLWERMRVRCPLEQLSTGWKKKCNFVFPGTLAKGQKSQRKDEVNLQKKRRHDRGKLNFQYACGNL